MDKTMVTIKTRNDFKIVNFISASILIFSIIFFVCGVYLAKHFAGSVSAFLNVIPLLILGTVLGTILSIYLKSRDESAQSKRYLSWVKEQNVDLQIKLTASPELDDESKNIIINYLNDNHKGWSLA
jgi:hypothetical protein